MKKIKGIILILGILILILIAIIVITYKNKNHINESKEDEALRIEKTTDFKDYVTVLTSQQQYFVIKNCIEKYYVNINQLSKKEEYLDRYEYSEEQYNNMMKETFEKAYNMLDEEYIKQFNITKTNIADKYDNYNETEFYIDQIYMQDISSNITAFIVYGRERNITTNEINNGSFLIKLDKINLTFSISLDEYIIKNKLNNVKENDKINFVNIEKIDAKIYNFYKVEAVTDEMVAKEYFSQYKLNLLYDAKTLYNKLDDEYKIKRFGTLEKYKQYLKENIDDLKKAEIKGYQVKQYDDYIQYICLDQNDNYYMFNASEILEYKIILDTYTIDVPEFIEKYNSTTNQGRVALNINKFFEAINSGDYNYAYNCLSSGFKSNYFQNANLFEEYIKNNMYQKNKITFETFKEEAGLYKYTINIINEMNGTESIQKTFIVRLNEGISFELSFNVE